MAEEKNDFRGEELQEESEQKEESVKLSKKEKKSRLEAKIESLEEELDKANEMIEEWKNKYYLTLADTQNLRKSLESEKNDALRYRAAGFLEELFPILDSFYFSLQGVPSNEETARYRTGYQYIYNQIEQVLEKEGVKELIPNVGDEFDHSYMYAIDTEETEGEENKVTKVFNKGYKLHDRLIRPAMVCVSKKKKAEEPKEENAGDNITDSKANQA